MKEIEKWLKNTIDENLYNDMEGEVEEALRECATGDVVAKEKVKNYILNLIHKENKTELVNKVINFENSSFISVEDKFNIIMFRYKMKYKFNALEKIIKNNKLDVIREKNDRSNYYIDKQDIEKIYREEKIMLSKVEKSKVITQKLYSRYKGFGIIDDILDMNIDGVSGGVNYNGNQNESVWIFFEGKSVHMKFLDFGNDEELKRISDNLYKYNTLKQLSKKTGYVISKMRNGSRVVVATPEFAETRMFFVRKFSSEQKELEDLVVGENSIKVIELIKYLVRGSRNIAITGQQGVGKTTLLTAMIGYVYDIYPIRIFETNFEINARELYKTKNICSFQETDNISIKEALDFGKKTDGSVTIIGEVSNDQVAAHIIEISQVASKFTMFTHHAKKFENLIMALRNSLLNIGSFKDELVAKEQVISVLEFDVHIDKDFYGKRYISRITECIKKNGAEYEENNIVRFSNEKFVLENKISEQKTCEMINEMTKEDADDFKFWIKSNFS